MKELNEEIMSRKYFDDIFSNIQKVHEHLPLASNTDFDCYKKMIGHFEATCGKFSEYGMKYMRSFYDICYHAANSDSKNMVSEVIGLVNKACPEGKIF